MATIYTDILVVGGVPGGFSTDVPAAMNRSEKKIKVVGQGKLLKQAFR